MRINNVKKSITIKIGDKEMSK